MKNINSSLSNERKISSPSDIKPISLPIPKSTVPNARQGPITAFAGLIKAFIYKRKTFKTRNGDSCGVPLAGPPNPSDSRLCDIYYQCSN